MTVPLNIELKMRGGYNPDPEMDTIEHNIAEHAWERLQNTPEWAELGIKKAYNLFHFNTFWMTEDPRLIKLLYRLEPYPSYLEFEAVQGCPWKCKMCETTYWDEPNQSISWSKFKHIVKQFPELKWCGVNALGEPYVNKNFVKMHKYLSDMGVCQELYTTAQMLEEKDMEKYVKMGFEYFKFSLDAATPETWDKLRPNMDWEKTIGNVIALDYYKKKHGKHFPKISFHYLITKPTIGEAEDFVDVISDLDVDVEEIYFSRLLWDVKEWHDLFVEVPQKLTEKIEERGKKKGIRCTFSQDMPHLHPPINECVAWGMPYIFPDGSVISCCPMNLQNRRDWQRDTRLGNIHEKPFREIWRDKPYSKMRKLLWEGKPKQAHPTCAICNIYNRNKISCISDEK